MSGFHWTVCAFEFVSCRDYGKFDDMGEDDDDDEEETKSAEEEGKEDEEQKLRTRKWKQNPRSIRS